MERVNEFITNYINPERKIHDIDNGWYVRIRASVTPAEIRLLEEIEDFGEVEIYAAGPFERRLQTGCGCFEPPNEHLMCNIMGALEILMHLAGLPSLFDNTPVPKPPSGFHANIEQALNVLMCLAGILERE
jgi:hypothetical protein